MILYFLWIDVSKHGLFCHNCNTLTSLYLCVWLACKPASPGGSRATGLKLITPLSVWKTPISIDWLWHGYDQQFGSCYLCRPTANIRENRRDDSCEVGTYLNQCCNFQSNCVRARNRCFWSSNLECVLMNCWQISCRPSSSELLGYPLCIVDSAPRWTNMQPRDSLVVNRRTSNANTRHWRPDQTHCTHQDVKIPDY